LLATCPGKTCNIYTQILAAASTASIRREVVLDVICLASTAYHKTNSLSCWYAQGNNNNQCQATTV
jgi:hypothetical protein